MSLITDYVVDMPKKKTISTCVIVATVIVLSIVAIAMYLRYKKRKARDEDAPTNIAINARRLNPERARVRFAEALTNIRNEALGRITQPRRELGVQRQNRVNFGPRAIGYRPARVNEPPPILGFAVDAALTFALGLDRYTAADAAAIQRTLDDDDDVDVLIQLINMPLFENAVHTRSQVTAARVANARAEATPAARTAAYMRSATEHTNDTQNVHDSAVNGCLRAIVDRLKADQANEKLPSLDDVKNEISADGARLSENRPSVLNDVLAVIDRAKKGEKNSSIGLTDEEAIYRVWARTNDPRNVGTRDKMRQALFDELASAWEDGIGGRHIVCVSGRSSRALGALSTLDWDKRNWQVSTLEQIKNEIFTKTAALIDREASIAANSSEPAKRAIGASFLAKTSAELAALPPRDEKAAAEFVTHVRSAIENLVDAEVAAVNKISPGAILSPVAESIKKEAVAAVNL